MTIQPLNRVLEAVTSLGDPMRRRLYEVVAASDRPLSRNEVARATGAARPLVAYHLDRLVKDGLLNTRFERQTGRTGPGAGRPAKLYFRPDHALRLTLPPRDPDFAAEIFAEAIGASPGPETEARVKELARQAGARLAQALPQDEGARETALVQLLAERGYEPRGDGEETWLRNCIFGELASKHRELVCGMNHAFIQGMLESLPGTALDAALEPAEGRCCVVLHPSSSRQ